MRPRSLDSFLRARRIPFTTFQHPPAFTAQEGAAVSHVPGGSWAKVVVCVADGELILAVVPAHRMVDLEALCVLAGAQAVRMAQEPEFSACYPDCELGAMPPFGTLYKQRVFVDASLVGDPEMVFNAGTHSDCIRMHYGDFAELSNPIVGAIARRPEAGAAEESAAAV